ncbi:hypothetical protein [Streptomyces sp. MMBL 11-1]|uniref:hypothetical protein n=1 Tax=Streptomyces sp. MMBL 11-1 TaxID=3026420 RepID=UPI00235EE91F|nr:hypothetical protein [Streptomyces sp. MMBL 11-1]
MTKHWHAYGYTGRSYKDGEVRAGVAPSTYPPFEIMHWLARPARDIEETFTEIDAAVEWLRGALELHVPLGAESFTIEDRLAYARSALAQAAGSDVVYGYYSVGRLYVSRALITCPRKRLNNFGEAPPPCPTGLV